MSSSLTNNDTIASQTSDGSASETVFTMSDYLPIMGLLLLSLVPLLAGFVRLMQLSTGVEITPENARFFAQPVPVVIHIVTVSVYAVLGAFQFSATLRRRALHWHRRAGRLLVTCGLLAASTGIWMSLFYSLPDTDGPLLLFFRLVFGASMFLALILGVSAVRRGNISHHRAWMMRAYAIALGAGTQVFTHIPWMLAMGTPDDTTRAWLMGAGWLINLAVAELIILRNRKPTAPPVMPAAA